MFPFLCGNLCCSSHSDPIPVPQHLNVTRSNLNVISFIISTLYNYKPCLRCTFVLFLCYVTGISRPQTFHVFNVQHVKALVISISCVSSHKHSLHQRWLSQPDITAGVEHFRHHSSEFIGWGSPLAHLATRKIARRTGGTGCYISGRYVLPCCRPCKCNHPWSCIERNDT